MLYKGLFSALESLESVFFGPNGVPYLEDLLGPLLHARPHLVAKSPQRVELQDGVDALAGLLVLELRHHHLAHCVGDLDGTEEEHGGWRGLEKRGKCIIIIKKHWEKAKL